ncbi:YetF domain-containing protein [Planococcus sp. ISL-110]|uniref:YetF domain-containing protein n=1 Tax=Planococcus sp. ISL-110 TaxID=2819167 RepID=UPI001BE9647B|nr:YetF domain-containing protein [Planococcus sp. ISL-110]MBT2571153.1 DUF421 domain-containing protein [Planococcus sp. ISL-110]
MPEWARVIIQALIAFPFLCLLKKLGKNSLSQINVVDIILSIVYGIVLSSIFLIPSISFGLSLLMLGLLTLLLLISAKFDRKSSSFRDMIKADSSFVYVQGEFNEILMKWNQLKVEDLRKAVHARGLDSLEQAEAILLEADGSLFVLKKRDSNKEATQKSDAKG